MRFRKHYSTIKGDLNLTPLIDVVFLQLIFFMLTSSFIMQPGIKVDLPQAKTTETIREEEVYVGISREGLIFYGNKPVTLAELGKFLQESSSRNVNVTLIVQGDKKAEYGTAVAVMDTARKEGINRIAIATTPDLLTK